MEAEQTAPRGGRAAAGSADNGGASTGRWYRWRLHPECPHYLRCECGSAVTVAEIRQMAGDDELWLHAECLRGHRWRIGIKLQAEVVVWSWREAETT